MEKKLKWYSKLFIILGAVFGVILTFCSAVILNGSCFKSHNIDTTLTEKWMENLDDELLLNETIIPGSHDACTYKMYWLAGTQYLDIKEQLKSGIRYFDIRVRNNNGKYVIYHGPINGVEFEPVIDEIVSFLKNNKSETLILDFQHFDNGAEDFVFTQVKEKLGEYVIKNESDMSDLEFVSNLKIKDCRGKCVVLFGYGCYEEESFIFRRNNDECTVQGCSLDSYYYEKLNKGSSENYISEGLPFYCDLAEQKIEKEGFKGLFVLQGQLTDPLTIFGPYSREKTHDKNMSNYIKDLPNNPYFEKINIIMRDFVDPIKSQGIFELNFVK